MGEKLYLSIVFGHVGGASYKLFRRAINAIAYTREEFRHTVAFPEFIYDVAHEDEDTLLMLGYTIHEDWAEVVAVVVED